MDAQRLPVRPLRFVQPVLAEQHGGKDREVRGDVPVMSA